MPQPLTFHHSHVVRLWGLVGGGGGWHPSPRPRRSVIFVIWYTIPYPSVYVKVVGTDGTHINPQQQRRLRPFPVPIRGTGARRG